MWSYRHQHFTVHQLPALKDNYIYLIEDHNSEMLAVVDPAVAPVVRNACKKLAKPLTHILNTHHHWDHTDGNVELKTSFNCSVIGAESDAFRLPGIDIMVAEGKLQLGSLTVDVFAVPGHTSGHIAFLIDDALFCGDTLFGAGCGRLFEGSPGQMWQSLQKIAAMPAQTKIYCAHEYTLANLNFAKHVDEKNQDVIERVRSDSDKRAGDLPTIPSTIDIEKKTNPFLRPLDESFCKAYAAERRIDASPLSVFTDIRQRKDHF